jgi:hypothetical protein
VLAARERGSRLRDQAVLFRAGRGSDLLELELTRRRIPYVKYGGLRYLEAAHVKDLLALYRLADNPRDETAWFRLLQLLDGVGPATARRVVDSLDLDRDGVLDRWDGAGCPSARGRRRPAGDRAGESGPERAETLRLALVPGGPGGIPGRCGAAGRLERLSAAAAEHGDLRTFVVELALDPPRSTGADAVPPSVDEDWLVLSTVHSAKGLEWNAVHLLHVTEGSFPSDLGVSTPDGLDEERRLFHVALTRARDALHLYAPLRYHHHPRARDDRHSFAQRSRFLDETALACCDRVGAAPGPGRSPRSAARRPRRPGRSRPSSTRSGSRPGAGHVQLEPDGLAEAAPVRLDAPPVGHRLDQVQPAAGGVPAADLDQLRPPVAGVGHPDPQPVAGQSHGEHQLLPGLPDRVGHQLGGQQRRRVERVRVDQVPQQVGDQPAAHARALRGRRQHPPQRRAGRGPVADQLPDQQHGVVRCRRVNQAGQRVGQRVRSADHAVADGIEHALQPRLHARAGHRRAAGRR